MTNTPVAQKRSSLRALASTFTVLAATLAACDTTVPPEAENGLAAQGAEEAHTGTTSAALTTFELCQQDAVARGVAVKAAGGTDAAARKALEIAFALCEDPARTPANAAFLGAFNADFAHLGSMFAAGALSLAEYRLVSTDRSRKYQAMLASPTAQATLAAGDADGDLVPDRSDRCPGTVYGVATDDSGCPTSPAPKGDASLVRALSGTKVLYNPSCKDAPPPLMPVPMEWGRGQQTKLGTVGYNLWVSRSGGEPPGCEIFYEFDLRFTNPSVAGSPPVFYAHMVMREGEDLLTSTTSATFGLPLGPSLSPGRNAVRDAMGNYSTVGWKVRAVNGSQVASPWSAVRIAGPASSGVKG